MLNFKVTWLDVPDEGDPLDCRTFAMFEWTLNHRVITRNSRRESRRESYRSDVAIPLFPLAQWLVDHWQWLLYETMPFDQLPTPAVGKTTEELDWLRCHCVRASTPGFALPFVCIYSQGNDVRIVSQADPKEQTSVEFLSNADFLGSREFVSRNFAGLIAGVLKRVEDSDDIRVLDLRSNWERVKEGVNVETTF